MLEEGRSWEALCLSLLSSLGAPLQLAGDGALVSASWHSRVALPSCVGRSWLSFCCPSPSCFDAFVTYSLGLLKSSITCAANSLGLNSSCFKHGTSATSAFLE